MNIINNTLSTLNIKGNKSGKITQTICTSIFSMKVNNMNTYLENPVEAEEI